MDGYTYLYLCQTCTDQCSLEATLDKNEIESLQLSQGGKKKNRPNKQRAVLIWKVRVRTLDFQHILEETDSHDSQLDLGAFQHRFDVSHLTSNISQWALLNYLKADMAQNFEKF